MGSEIEIYKDRTIFLFRTDSITRVNDDDGTEGRKSALQDMYFIWIEAVLNIGFYILIGLWSCNKDKWRASGGGREKNEKKETKMWYDRVKSLAKYTHVNIQSRSIFALLQSLRTRSELFIFHAKPVLYKMSTDQPE